MNQPKTGRRYGATAQGLHWIVAGFIVTHRNLEHGRHRHAWRPVALKLFRQVRPAAR